MIEKGRRTFRKIVCLLAVIIVFSLAFVLLIKKQYGDKRLGDVASNGFEVKTIYGKQIVAQDLDAIYPKYYVAYIYDGGYVIHTFNYYNTNSQYELEFNRLLDSIVDYNAKENMIRCFHSSGYSPYDFVKENFGDLINNPNIVIFE